MNQKLKRIWRSGMALLLTFVMMFSTCGTVFATEGDGKETIKYVSLGDSMSNGYGLDGYDNNGHESYGKEAYPNQFAEWLVDEGYADEVEHSQLAVSAMRAEDLHFILEYGQEGAYQGDQYTVNNFTEGRFDDDNGFDSTEAAAAEYQTAVKNADIISVGTGNANFGVFLMYSVMDAVGALGDTEDGYNWVKFEDALVECDAETKNFALQAYETIKTQLLAKVPAEANEMATKVADRMAYVVTSYVLNYGGALEAIAKLNPKAEIMIVGLMNSMNGLVIDCTIDGQSFELPVGEVMGSMIGTINAYLAALPAILQAGGKYPEATFYFASSPNVEMIVNVLDKEMMQNKNSVVRKRTISEIIKIVWPMLNAMTLENDTTADDNPYTEILVEDVAAYEDAIAKGSFGQWISDNSSKALPVVTYVAFENAAIEASSKKDPLNGAALLKLMDMAALAKSFYTIYDQFEKNIADPDFGKNAAFMQVAGDNAVVYQMLALPDAMSAALLADEDMESLLNLFARMMVGDGIGCHPSANGHDSLAKAVKESYASEHTVQDETIENIETALAALCEVLEKYGPEVAAQVWAQWEEYGYVDAVNETIDKLTAILEERYEIYTTETLPAVNASVAALTEQKEALTAQLTSLNEQLAAKKAELEKVLSEQEIGSVTVPDINIDIELGNNEQTSVPEHDCVVSVDGNAIVAELEAAIKDIEHAIATVEALVADVEADIEDMVALAVQIADAVASFETTIKDIANAAKDLKAAVEAVVEVLTDEAAGSIISTVVGTYETVRNIALEAANLLDIAMVAAEETMADIDEMVVILSGDAEALYNKFMTDLPGCIEQIPEEGQLLLGAAVLGLQKAYEEGEKLVNEKLAAEIAALEAEYADDIAKAKADLEAIQVEIQAEIEAKYAEVVAETQIKIDAAKAEAAEKIAALEAELKGYQAELAALGADAAEEVRQTIQAQIDRVTADIATVSEDLACAVEHLEEALQLTYEAIVAEVNALYEEVIAQLEKVYNDIMAELEAAKKALEEAAGKTLEELKEAIDKQIEEFNKIIGEISKEIDSVLDSIRENIKNVQDAVKEILSGSLESVEELKNTLAAMGAEALAELVDIIVEQINAMLLEATTADMVVDDDFKFVAIGDESAMAEGYVEKLAAAINAEAAANGVSDIEVVNNAKSGNTVAAERANLSDVTDADLITIGFSNVTFLSNALDAAMSGQTDFDWAGLLGEEAVPYVEDILADINAEIAALELEEGYTVMIETIVEAMAYNALEYAATLPGLISDIKAVNSDALIIIVGMYNPLADTTINVGGAAIDVSEYVDYLVNAVAVHGVAYAVISGDAIYVDARDVAVENTDKELSAADLTMLIYNKCVALYPNAAGDDYIAGEIADALDITYVKTEKLLGDVNDDGVVDSRDLVRLRRYFAQDGSVINALNSDVNEDGVVDSRDMTRLTKFFAQADDVVLGK